MKSMAEELIDASLSNNKGKPDYNKILKRKEMFEVIKDCDFETRCAITEKLFQALRFDCYDYKTCEHLALEEALEELETTKKVLKTKEYNDMNWEHLKNIFKKENLIYVEKDADKVSKNSTSKKIKVYLDKSAYMPTKAHNADAGFDLRTPYDFTIEAGDSIVVDTGIHIQIPVGYVGFIKSKSGLNVKHDLITEGVIDSGYTGSIVVKIYSLGEHSRAFRRGDKITQLVLLPIPDYVLEQTKMPLDATERGNEGFGSTGR